MADKYGYPTEEELETIRNYDIINSSLDEFMELIKSIWQYPEYIKHQDHKWHVSTVGWSGNEDIICAMKRNTLFWMLYWEQSRRGGHYIFSQMRAEDIK